MFPQLPPPPGPRTAAKARSTRTGRRFRARERRRAGARGPEPRKLHRRSLEHRREFRTQLAASALTFSSRFLAGPPPGAARRPRWGTPARRIALVRGAADHRPAALPVCETRFSRVAEWLDDGRRRAPPRTCTRVEFRLQRFARRRCSPPSRYSARSTAPPRTSLPHFGATALLTAQDSDAGPHRADIRRP